MIRLLFLDDSKERHDRFKKWINSRAIAENIQFSPVYVYTAKDAIMALRYKKFDEIWLDHDLGPDEAGYDVALYIETLYHENNNTPLKSRIIIHSHNPVGADRMMKALQGKVQAIVRKPFEA